MSQFLEYRGYLGSVEYSHEDSCLWGKIQFIDELILYDGSSIDEIKKSFEDAVDAYIDLCNKIGREPSAPFKGSLNVRIGQDLHRKAAYESKRQGITLNDFIKEAVEERINGCWIGANTKAIHEHKITVEHILKTTADQPAQVWERKEVTWEDTSSKTKKKTVQRQH